MDLDQIRKRAEEEQHDITYIIYYIKETIKENPQGCDIYVPTYLLEKTQAYCDSNEIPFYHLHHTTCSIAKTYSALLEHEEER